MSRVFICTTPYHVFISIVKTILSNRASLDDIIITEPHNFQPTFFKKLHNSKIFNFTYHFDCTNEYLGLKGFILKTGFFPKWSFKNCPLTIDYFKERELFLFTDHTYLGQLLNKFHIRYNLLEDGLDTFKLGIPYNRKFSFFGLLYKVSGIYPTGLSPMIQSIEVNDKKNILLKKKNICECPRKTLFEKLSSEQRNQIIEIFEAESIIPSIRPDSTLLLTQPLSEDNIMSHEDKIRLYKFLVGKYGKKHLYIKAHPREIEHYVKIFPNATILKNAKIPIEVLNLNNSFCFENIITAFSTAIFSDQLIANEKILFGYKETLDFPEKKDLINPS